MTLLAVPELKTEAKDTVVAPAESAPRVDLTAGAQSARRPNAAIQVSHDHYLGDYLNLPRMITYWYQAKVVRDCGGDRALEIGLGMGLTTWILRRWGLDVSTLDVDPQLRPSIVGDLRRMPFADNAYDTILIAEVLEHLPFDQFDAALAELRRVTRRSLVITLPCPLVGFNIGVNLPILEPIFLSLGFRQMSKPRFDGQHYWELDRIGYPKRRIREHIRSAGFEITREFRPGLSLYNYFFVLDKR
ncbi:MAG TPA: class I SAM-dependent methyltransferase [Phycisphaerae bacterium]|nr:class I SAM-dependent methyltransferase [Phycisphaerae bacterium]HRW53196.1 class I SAM-dependent methyltransferase [Phycisphaerae bacterium]